MGFGILQAAPMQAAAEFSLPPLPYSANALEPAVDGSTMKIHHDLHHGAYVANLNAQIPTFPELAWRISAHCKAQSRNTQLLFATMEEATTTTVCFGL
jgi:superoxide dismutase